MALKLQILIACIVIIVLFYIINMVRKRKIQLKGALSWIFLALLILILDIFPQIMLYFAELVGVEVPSNMIFFIGFLVVLAMLYSSGVAISSLQVKVQRLTQEIALLEKELNALKDRDVNG